jgi:hypothetical protein
MQSKHEILNTTPRFQEVFTEQGTTNIFNAYRSESVAADNRPKSRGKTRFATNLDFTPSNPNDMHCKNRVNRVTLRPVGQPTDYVNSGPPTIPMKSF